MAGMVASLDWVLVTYSKQSVLCLSLDDHWLTFSWDQCPPFMFVCLWIFLEQLKAAKLLLSTLLPPRSWASMARAEQCFVWFTYIAIVSLTPLTSWDNLTLLWTVNLPGPFVQSNAGIYEFSVWMFSSPFQIDFESDQHKSLVHLPTLLQ